MGEVTSINLDEGYINYIVCNEQNEIEIIGLAYLDEYRTKRQKLKRDL